VRSLACLWLGFLRRRFGMVSVGFKSQLKFVINREIVGKTEKIAAADLAKLWVLADRCLMPRLQNLVVEKLGDPDDWSHIPKIPDSLENSDITAHREPITYANSTEGIDTPLKRYCARLLLSRIEGDDHDRHTMSAWDFLAHRQNQVYSITGPGAAADVIKLLLDTNRDLEVNLKDWDSADYAVEESY
jgi:hypothetical protein